MTFELGAGESNLSRFTADFWEDKVYINGQAFPAGYFMVPLLNNDNAILGMFSLYGKDLWPLIDQLERGFVNYREFTRAREIAHEMRALVQKLEPFCYLNDSEYEDGRIDFLLRDSRYHELKEYFLLIGKQTERNNMERNSFHQYLSEKEQRIINDGKYYCEHLMELLKFYALLFKDGAMMYHAANELAESLEGMLKLDERKLIEKICELFPEGYSYHGNENASGTRESIRLVCTDVEYIALQLPDSRKKKVVTARRMYFSRWIDFIIADFFEGIHHCHYPKKCAVCGRYFLIEDGRNRIYCDGIDPNDERGRSCRQVGTDRKRKARENPKVHPVKEACRKRINTINQHRYRGKITKEFADAARKIAQDCRDRALMDSRYARTQYKADISQEGIYEAAKRALERKR